MNPTSPGQRQTLHPRVAQMMEAITEEGPLPYVDLLPRLTGIRTVGHVRGLVSDAEDEGLLRAGTDDGQLPEGLTAGRANATQYVEIARSGGCVVGLNIGRTYFAIGVADANGHLLSTAPKPSKGPGEKAEAEARYAAGQIVTHEREDGVDGRALLKRAADETIAWLEKVGVADDELRGITLSLPAPVSTTESKVLTSSIEGALGGVESIEREFRAKLGSTRFPRLEKVILANDADVAARGEVRYGKAYGKKDVIALHAAYGVGAGIVTDGKVLRTGAGGGAGEIGHCVPRVSRDEGVNHGLAKLDPGADLFTCICDGPGHLEALAGGQAIVNRLEASLETVDPPPPDQLAKLLKDRNRSLSATLDALLEAISGVGSDPWQPGLEAVLDSAHMIGGAAHTLAHLLKPEAIYVCGKLSEAGAPFLDVVVEGFEEPGSLQNYRPEIDLGHATDEFGRRLLMVRGAAMTAVRGTQPLTLAGLKRDAPA